MKFIQLILIAIMSIISHDAKSQVLKIYLNTNDCINCIASLAQLESLNSSIRIQIMCDDKKKEYIPELLNRLGIDKSNRTSIVYIKSSAIYSKSKNYTYCEYTIDDKILFSFKIHDLSQYILAMNRSHSSYNNIDYVSIKAIQKLSDRVNLFFVGNEIVAVDYLFQQAYLFNAQQLGGDSVVYFHDLHMNDSIISGIIRRNKIHPHIEMPDSITKTQLPDYISISSKIMSAIPYPHGFQFVDYIEHTEASNELDTTQGVEIVYFNYVKGVIEPIFHNNWINIAPYMIVLKWGYHLSGTTLTIPVFKMMSVDDGPLYLLADWRQRGDSVIFQNFRPLECPSELHEYIIQHPNFIISCKIREGLYSPSIYPIVYNLTNNKTFDLSSLLRNRHKQYFTNEKPIYTMLDILPLNDNIILLLYRMKEKSKLAWIDIGKRRILKQISINTTSFDKYSLRIMDDGRIIGFSNDSQKLVISQ